MQLSALLFHRVSAYLTTTGLCKIVESRVASVQVHETAFFVLKNALLIPLVAYFELSVQDIRTP